MPGRPSVKVAQIMKPIRLALDHLDFVIDPLQLARVDRMTTMIQNPLAVFLQHFHKLRQRSQVQAERQRASRPTARMIRPDFLQFLAQNVHRAKRRVVPA